MLNSEEGKRGQMDSMFSAQHSGANWRERALLFMKNMWNQSNPNYPPAVHVARRASRPSRGTATQIERASLLITPYRLAAVGISCTNDVHACCYTFIVWMAGIHMSNHIHYHISECEHTHTQCVWGASDSKTPGWWDQYGKREMIHRHCRLFKLIYIHAQTHRHVNTRRI